MPVSQTTNPKQQFGSSPGAGSDTAAKNVSKSRLHLFLCRSHAISDAIAFSKSLEAWDDVHYAGIYKGLYCIGASVASLTRRVSAEIELNFPALIATELFIYSVTKYGGQSNG